MHEIFDLNINFEFGKFDSRSMTVNAMYNDKTYPADINNPNLIIKSIKLPTKIIIKFLGKTLGKDTKVDENGNILEDMYVKIKSIKIDNLNVPEWVLQKKLSYTTEHDLVLKTSYIGFNGTMELDIPETNIFSFYRRLNKDE